MEEITTTPTKIKMITKATNVTIITTTIATMIIIIATIIIALRLDANKAAAATFTIDSNKSTTTAGV